MRAELIQITYALAVADHRSIARAATALEVQQSTVSRCITRLEDRLGIALFERSKRGARPTNAGEAFLEEARKALDLLDRAVADAMMAGRGEIGRVSAGLGAAVAVSAAQALMAEQQLHHVDVDLRLVEDNADRLVASLFNRSLDLAVLPGPIGPTPVDRHRLWTERLFLAVPDELLAGRETTEWEDLALAPVLCVRWKGWENLQQFLQARGGPQVEFRILDCLRETILGMVAAGAGVTIIPESATRIARPGVRCLPINGPDAIMPVCVAWLAENDNPALRRLISGLRVRYPKTAEASP